MQHDSGGLCNCGIEDITAVSYLTALSSQGFSYAFDIDVRVDDKNTLQLHKLLREKLEATSLTVSPICLDRNRKLCANEAGFANDYRTQVCIGSTLCVAASLDTWNPCLFRTLSAI